MSVHSLHMNTRRYHTSMFIDIGLNRHIHPCKHACVYLDVSIYAYVKEFVFVLTGQNLEAGGKSHFFTFV